MKNTNGTSKTKLHKRKADHKQKRQTVPRPGENKHKQKPKDTSRPLAWGKLQKWNINRTQRIQADPQPGETPNKIKITTTVNPGKPRINILNELGGRRWVFLRKLMSDLVSNASAQRELGSRAC